ncbi:MAG: glycosyltransferase family 4 protein [Rhodospirillaceae bacterium]|jgi:UDP-N-acetylmuramyl pentapeptide phosphotransferase/UDP-N-acetylglucosamine-1-phosphate transferase|nr:glycosyltransferase family 4 protein [Rhodospirillaceae bacterium]
MTIAAATIQALLAFFGVVAGVGALIQILRRRAILAHPNERSSHTIPTPHGGGIAVVAVIAILWGWRAVASGDIWLGAVLAAALALAAVSWIDDLRSLPPVTRLMAQGLAVAVGTASLLDGGFFFQGFLPGWLDPLAAALGWIWFVNLFNFMDGIDGISGIETACVGGGAALVAVLAPDLSPGAGGLTPVYGLTLAAAALGFLVWNWHPAKIFLGDVGSVPIGFLLGWILLDLAAAGLWAPALILPLYYLADATITLTRRALRGEKIWRAHREHFYQRATQNGRSHAQVSLTILSGNVTLVALAVAALSWPWVALGAAALTVAILLWRLGR